MRKTLSFILVSMLLVTGSISAFAADTTIPSDVLGTKYETAVKKLVEKEIVKGYSDGTFRPEQPIDRAEVCSIIVNAMDPSDAELNAAKSAFSDMKEYGWAERFVNYAADKGVVSGYGDGIFKPSNNVTYNEIATMLVKAMGYSDKDLSGTYPASYVAKAQELGILKDVPIGENGDNAATRGDVAMMVSAVSEQIYDKYHSESPEGNGSDDKPTTGSSVTPSDNDAAIFKDAGGAFGMINGYSKVVDKDGSNVVQIEFLMNGETYKLNTDKTDLSDPIKYDGSLYYIKFNMDKTVKDIYQNPNEGRPKHYAVLAGSGDWADVSDRSKRVLTVAEAGASDSKELTILNDAVYYKATFDGGSIDGYEKGSLSDIDAGAKIRAYDVTDDKSAVADVVVYVTKRDAEKYL